LSRCRPNNVGVIVCATLIASPVLVLRGRAHQGRQTRQHIWGSSTLVRGTRSSNSHPLYCFSLTTGPPYSSTPRRRTVSTNHRSHTHTHNHRSHKANSCTDLPLYHLTVLSPLEDKCSRIRITYLSIPTPRSLSQCTPCASLPFPTRLVLVLE
jgi:hypothetical protein